MLKQFGYIFGLFVLLFPCVLKGEKNDGDWRLIWADEFDVDGAPNAENWIYENGLVRNRELQWYQPDNVTCSNGLLIIEGRRERVANPNYDPNAPNWRKNRHYAEYTSSSLKTQGKFSWQYGRLEVRARINVQVGMWPAIWTLGVSGEWPSSGEVDVFEYYQRRGEPTILANTAWSTSEQRVAKWDTETRHLSYFLEKDPDWASKFHVWRMDWTEESIRLYLDDELINSTDLSRTINADGSNPFHHPHYLIINLAIGSVGGNPSGSVFPVQYEIDYARVYQSIQDEWIKVDDQDAGLSYKGWSAEEGGNGYDQTRHVSRTAGSEATLSFTGIRARFYGFKRKDLGYAEILLDGVSQGLINCYSDAAEYDVMLYETPELLNDRHTLTVRVAGTNHLASSGTKVIVDAFASLPGAPWLSLIPAGSDQSTIFWTPDIPDWVLQQSASLTSKNWINVTETSTNFFVVPNSNTSMFYRLHKR